MSWRNYVLLALLAGWGWSLTSCTVPPTVTTEVEGPSAAAQVEESSETETAVEESTEELAMPDPTPIDPGVEVSEGNSQLTLWLTDVETGSRVQQLLSKDSQNFTAEFSSDKTWLVVSELAFSDLQTLHLFKRSAPNQFTKVEREKFTGGIWDAFIGELQYGGVITRYATTFKGWQEDEKAVLLELGVLPKNGNWIQKDYVVELAQF